MLIDLLAPSRSGEKLGLLGGAGVGKTLGIMKLINDIVKVHRGVSVFDGVDGCTREKNDL